MTISDALNFLGIVVSIIFGFLISHYCSIRDARTRAIKDYNMEQVKAIRGRIDSFFHKISFGKSSFNKVVDWYGHLSIDVRSVDNGVRKSLDIQIDDISNVLDRYYGEITSWEDFNDQYPLSQYIPNIEHKERLKKMKIECDDFLDEYLCHVNQSNAYPIWKVQWKKIKASRKYYESKGRKCPICLSIWERVEKHLIEILIISILIMTFCFLCSKIVHEEKVDIVTPLNNISNTQDSLYKEFRMFREKYKPVEIESKTFNNSSFFNADKVDSVHIKLYQGQPKE